MRILTMKKQRVACVLYVVVAVLSLASVSDVSGFTFPPSTRLTLLNQQDTCSNKDIITLLSLADREDDYDAWLEKLDPTNFEEGDTSYDTSPNNRNNGNSFSSNSRRSDSSPARGGFPSHDYQRDWNADKSRVDEAAVDRMIADRLRARKKGDFEVADGIRDQLMQEHGVSVSDKERLWRSGCSAGGSGRKWSERGPPQQQQRYGNNNGYSDRRGRDDDRRGRDDDRRGRDDDRRGRERFGGMPDRDRGRKPQRERNFGPNGHDYSYAADAGPVSSPLSEPAIHDLISRRMQCKFARNFREADAIQDQLSSQGVFINDGIKEWRGDGQPFPAGEKQRGFDGRGSNTAYAMSQYSLPLIDPLQAEDMGPDEAQKAADALKAQVQDLVDQRLQARQDRAYNVADALREDLERDYNVYVDDRKREWSVGGNFAAPPGAIEMSPYSKPLAVLLGDATGDSALDDLQKKIQNMVDERLAAKLGRDFETADAIRDELMDTYDVLVRDDLRMWSIGGVFSPPPEPYTMSSYSPPPPESIDVGRIAALIEERDAARLQRDFLTADDIKVGLLEDYNIVINDKLKQWSVGGNFGPQQEESTTTSTPRGCVYAKRGGGSVSPEDEAAIEQLLNERAVHQLNKEYGKADRVRERLESIFSVRVDDRNREWHVVTNDFTYKVSAHSLDEDTLAYIQGQVNQREVARLQKEYEVADNIRDALMDQFAVSVDDRLKEWTVVVDPGDRVAAISHNMDRASEPEFGGNEEKTSGDEEVDPEHAPLEELTVVQLKELLRAKGLPVSGKKADLIERLQ